MYEMNVENFSAVSQQSIHQRTQERNVCLINMVAHS